jgi:hypothetical protein
MTFNDLGFGTAPVGRSPSIAQASKAHEPGVPIIKPEPVEQQIEQQQKPNPAMMKQETVVLLVEPRTTREKKIAENDTNLEEREKKAEETAMRRPSKEPEVDKSTSIIITSSLIPIHPSTLMIEMVVESCFKYLKGISPTVPIYIGVDMLSDNKKTPEKLNRLAQYIANLETIYANRTNIIIVPQYVHRHLAGMINQTLPLIKTKYLYVLQHDFPFSRDVDHPNLVKSMEEYPEYLRCVRFNYKRRNYHPQCLDLNKEGATPADHVNGLDFFSSKTWSDK